MAILTEEDMEDFVRFRESLGRLTKEEFASRVSEVFKMVVDTTAYHPSSRATVCIMAQQLTAETCNLVTVIGASIDKTEVIDCLKMAIAKLEQGDSPLN